MGGQKSWDSSRISQIWGEFRIFTPNPPTPPQPASSQAIKGRTLPTLKICEYISHAVEYTRGGWTSIELSYLPTCLTNSKDQQVWLCVRLEISSNSLLHTWLHINISWLDELYWVSINRWGGDKRQNRFMRENGAAHKDGGWPLLKLLWVSWSITCWLSFISPSSSSSSSFFPREIFNILIIMGTHSRAAKQAVVEETSEEASWRGSSQFWREKLKYADNWSSLNLKKHRKNCECCPGHSLTVSH